MMNFSRTRRQLLSLFATSPLFGVANISMSQIDDNHVRVTLAGQALMKYPICEAPYPGLAEVITELRKGDIIFTNLEVAIQTPESGAPTRDTEFFHAGSEQTLTCLDTMGFNLLALSNNHAFDLGTEGIVATRNAVARAGFAYAGTGNDITQASTAGYLEQPAKAALISMAMGRIREGGAATATRPGVNEVRLSDDLIPDADDMARNLASIKEARSRGGIVIVYLHNHEWGEDMALTKPWAREFAKQCIDAGADIFVSHGAQLLHGIELHRGKPIFHGLGSLIFHSHTEIGYYVPEVWETAIVHLDFQGSALHGMELQSMEIVPIVMNEIGDDPEQQWPTRGRPRMAQAQQAERILERLKHLSAELGLDIHVDSHRGYYP
jgi:poly-gamma-glutamate capsule biosynthesis protein CapA/YwtB (metallophosphatase superfamily)